jgi:hypothetical protein
MEFFDVARRVRYGLGIDVPEIKHVIVRYFIGDLLGAIIIGQELGRLHSVTRF